LQKSRQREHKERVEKDEVARTRFLDGGIEALKLLHEASVRREQMLVQKR
jgi:hypothetical protein